MSVKQSGGGRKRVQGREKARVRCTAQMPLVGVVSNAGKQYITLLSLLLFFICECLPEIIIMLFLIRAGVLVYQSVSIRTNTRANLLQYGQTVNPGLTANSLESNLSLQLKRACKNYWDRFYRYLSPTQFTVVSTIIVFKSICMSGTVILPGSRHTGILTNHSDFFSWITACLTLQSICNFSVAGASQGRRCRTSQESPNLFLRAYAHSGKESSI